MKLNDVDCDIYYGLYYYIPDDEMVVTPSGTVSSNGTYGNETHLCVCPKCLGSRVEYDTGYYCLHCEDKADIYNAPNREIYAVGIGNVIINAIGERVY